MPFFNLQRLQGEGDLTFYVFDVDFGWLYSQEILFIYLFFKIILLGRQENLGRGMNVRDTYSDVSTTTKWEMEMFDLTFVGGHARQNQNRIHQSPCCNSCPLITSTINFRAPWKRERERERERERRDCRSTHPHSSEIGFNHCAT